MTEEASPEEQRGSPRRWVMLRVRIEDAYSVELVWTINVSESGILIERPAALELHPGQSISVVIEGLLPDEVRRDASHRMVVVRVDEHVALRFDE